jgi:20S proteasome alpha/beta subunit
VTVCIGLVCNTGKHILLTADTRGSYGTVTSNEKMGKLFNLPGNFCGAIAGVGSECTDIVAELYHRMSSIPNDEFAPERVRASIVESYDTIFRTLVDEALRNEVKISLSEYHRDKTLAPRIKKQAHETLKRVMVEVQLIVAGFYKGMPVQFIADGGYEIKVRPEITPGNAVIGSGMDAALNWLNYRRQNIHTGLAQSLLHLTEAKQFAETNNFVGTFRETVLLWADNCRPLDWTQDAQQLLQAWWNKYGLPLSDGLNSKEQSEAIQRIFSLPKS